MEAFKVTITPEDEDSTDIKRHQIGLVWNGLLDSLELEVLH